MNGEYLKAMAPEVFYEKAEPYLERYLTADIDRRRVAELVRTRIETFPDIEEMVDFFNALPEYDIAMYTNKKSKSTAESARKVLTEVLPLLEKAESWTNDALFELLKQYAEQTGVKTGHVMWPIRTALSGKLMTPAGATEILELLGREEALRRLETGIQKLA